MQIVERYDIGNAVICDLCGTDYTNSLAVGGFLFCSTGVCPACVPRFEAKIIKHNEQRYIKARAQQFETFKDFSLRMREGNNKVTIYQG